MTKRIIGHFVKCQFDSANYFTFVHDVNLSLLLKQDNRSSGLPPWEAALMIAETRTFFFLVLTKKTGQQDNVLNISLIQLSNDFCA